MTDVPEFVDEFAAPLVDKFERFRIDHGDEAALGVVIVDAMLLATSEEIRAAWRKSLTTTTEPS